jgi:hypothetical protein
MSPTNISHLPFYNNEVNTSCNYFRSCNYLRQCLSVVPCLSLIISNLLMIVIMFMDISCYQYLGNVLKLFIFSQMTMYFMVVFMNKYRFMISVNLFISMILFAYTCSSYFNNTITDCDVLEFGQIVMYIFVILIIFNGVSMYFIL